MHKKMVIIGMDGLDPQMARRLISEGKLPNFKRLADAGSFNELQTSNPPQSPVAWSNFISGHNPGHHDVFDFINRNPHTYFPEVGMTETRKAEKKSFKELFKGMSGPGVQTRRKGKTFWDYLSENKIPSTVIRCPVTFPADNLNGNLLSGMGTPDIKGTQGIFSYYSTKKTSDEDVQGRVYTVSWKDNKFESVITGPKVRVKDKNKEIEVPLFVERTQTGVKVTIQGRSDEIKVGEWSDWFRIDFKLDFMKSISGIVRFHLNALEPELSFYATPVNIDPKNPAMKISHPDSYAKEVFENIGNFYTQGMPYDTWALNEGRIDEKTFIEMAYQIQDENLKHLNFELDRYEGGLLFCYFGITDLISHMFWRYTDPTHPNKGESADPQIQNAIENVYIHMDGVLGGIMKKVGDDALLIVLSDHGFGSFRQAVHLNSWLKDNGYLSLKNGDAEGQELFQNVDWVNTRAYSVGFGGIYVNQFGREKQGMVYKGAETEELVNEISQKLSKFKDKNGMNVVKNVYLKSDLYSGPYTFNGPDLFVGFDEGFRASWQTALGAAPKTLIENNMKKWGGDHLCDPSLVPGVLFSNRKMTGTDFSLLDMAPTVLSYFGIEIPQELEGKSIN